jgi:hypothetical protein
VESQNEEPRLADYARMDRPKSRLAPVLIVAGILCAALALYVAGYFFGGTARTLGPSQGRGFRWKWLCVAYAPVAGLEARMRGVEVVLYHQRGANSYERYDLFPP